MNWQETILTDEQLDEIGYPLLPIGDRTNSQRVAKTQAKVSYEAGQQKSTDALNDYADEKISLERCAELMDMNEYELISAFRHWAATEVKFVLNWLGDKRNATLS